MTRGYFSSDTNKFSGLQVIGAVVPQLKIKMKPGISSLVTSPLFEEMTALY